MITYAYFPVVSYSRKIKKRIYGTCALLKREAHKLGTRMAFLRLALI